MTLQELIYATYRELQDTNLRDAGIFLQDDTDGLGAWIVKWEYTKPMPDGCKLGK